MFGYGKIDRLKRRLLLRIGTLHYWRLIGIATAVAIVHILSVREGLLTAQAAIRVNQAVILLVCLVSVGMSYARMNYFRRMARIYVRVLRKTKWAAFLKLLIWLVAAIGFTVLLVSMVRRISGEGR